LEQDNPSYVGRALLANMQEDLMITEDYVRKIFKGLEQSDGVGFFEHVDDKVDWIVEGTSSAGRSLQVEI
jgi:hypothetical protein